MLIRLLLIFILATGSAFAQRGGGGGGGGGDTGGGGGGPANVAPSMLDRMTDTCKLSKDQKNQFKTILTAANKSAETLRKQILPSRQQIGAAVQAGKSADEVKKMVISDGMWRAQMTAMEYKAFGELYNVLDAEQKKANAQRLFAFMAGIFMNKNWNQ
jgi:hypothetical protein